MMVASVLPLEPQPVVSSSKDSSVEGLEELHHSMVEEPVGEGDDDLSPGVRVVRADESSQLWPLEVCCTVSEEDSGQTQSVDHGEEATPWCHADWRRSGGFDWRRPLPVSPPCPPAISWALPDIHSASLQSTLSHLGVECEESESRVSDETTAVVLHQVLEVVADGD